MQSLDVHCGGNNICRCKRNEALNNIGGRNMWWMDIQIAPWMNLIIIIKIPSDQLQLQEKIFKKNNDQQYSGI